MSGASSISRSNAQNRALQKSSGMKLFQKFGTAAPICTDKKRINLSEKRLAAANRIRVKKLIITACIALVIILPIVFYAIIWLSNH